MFDKWTVAEVSKKQAQWNDNVKWFDGAITVEASWKCVSSVYVSISENSEISFSTESWQIAALVYAEAQYFLDLINASQSVSYTLYSYPIQEIINLDETLLGLVTCSLNWRKILWFRGDLLAEHVSVVY